MALLLMWSYAVAVMFADTAQEEIKLVTQNIYPTTIYPNLFNFSFSLVHNFNLLMASLSQI